MADSRIKKQILEQAGYRYNFDRMLYVHRGQKKAFSVEFVDDHKAEEIQRRINERPAAGEWQFYFNGPISDGVSRAALSHRQSGRNKTKSGGLLIGSKQAPLRGEL